MRALQPSFSRGEITPLLRGRADMALYYTALARLLNFIALPQGGVARRPGFELLGQAASQGGNGCPVRLIPFVYSNEDSQIVELYDHGARAWLPSSGTASWQDTAPYAREDIEMVKHVQNGNVIFMAHREYPPQRLTRNALDDWDFEDFPFKGGPWLPDGLMEAPEDTKLQVFGDGGASGLIYDVKALDMPAGEGYFTPEMVGSLIKLNFFVKGHDYIRETEVPGEWIEFQAIIGGSFSLSTANNWLGEIMLQKSIDGGETWQDVFEYTRYNVQEQGQLTYPGAETKETLYRVRARHAEGTSVPIYVKLSVSGYSASDVFRITEYIDPGHVKAEWQKDPDSPRLSPIKGSEASATSDWQIGAWGGGNGYPGAVAFYQDRLVFAGTPKEPQTVWMSRVGDYTDFSVSDPIRDDDAITITLSAEENDGIHSLLAMADILAFTASSEWKIQGAGDNGAIAPSAVVAHRQDNIGSAPIQPVLVHGQPFLVQLHRKEAHVLSYAMDMDGYSGSNVSIMSQHLFSWKEQENAPPADRRITRLMFQQVPDSLVWLVLADGTAATCTYLAEHGVIAWARQETAGHIGDAACIPAGGGSQAWFAVERGGVWGIERLAPREAESLFVDAGSYGYESGLETLRLNVDAQGTVFSAKKLIARLAVLAVRGKGAWICPATDRARDRRRMIEWEYSGDMTESEIMLDGGFENSAGVQIWTDGPEPLTILALSPVFAIGK
jgi:hypothetical protein